MRAHWYIDPRGDHRIEIFVFIGKRAAEDIRRALRIINQSDKERKRGVIGKGLNILLAKEEKEAPKSRPAISKLPLNPIKQNRAGNGSKCH